MCGLLNLFPSDRPIAKVVLATRIIPGGTASTGVDQFHRPDLWNWNDRPQNDGENSDGRSPSPAISGRLIRFFDLQPGFSTRPGRTAADEENVVRARTKAAVECLELEDGVYHRPAGRGETSPLDDSRRGCGVRRAPVARPVRSYSSTWSGSQSIPETEVRFFQSPQQNLFELR
jgi:hypothetical protein